VFRGLPVQDTDSNLWMIVVDNRALSQASKRAQETDIPLIVLFVISPQDYVAHDRGPRKVDFVLRNLKSIKVCWRGEQTCPRHVLTETPRTGFAQRT